MSGTGAPTSGPVDASHLRIGVVVASWHLRVSESLLAGALRALRDCSVADPQVVRVAGAFELPVVAKAFASARYDAAVCLGVVIRGETPHFDYVCRAVTDGCTQVAVMSGMPVGFGVLTCDNAEQALARAGLPESREDKGHEAALAAVTTALAVKELREHPA